MKTLSFAISILAYLCSPVARAGADDELDRLQSEHKMAISKVNQTHLQSLKALRSKYQKQQDANAVAKIDAAIQLFAPFPQTKGELKQYLIGTKWTTFDRSQNKNVEFTFLADGKFSNGNSKPEFIVTGRRHVTIIWAPLTNIPCEISEDCMIMKELSGQLVVFRRVL